MKQYNKFNNILGWITFAISAVVYLMTIESSASFWDCGEFIASADRLQVGHPPGAPVFSLIARLFILFAGSPANVAIMVNSMSALASAFTIMFLFWSITHLARKLLGVTADNINKGQMYAVFGAGLVGALAYTFSDTFWFSAVEGEVYAMSSLFTAAVFWAMLKWENEADQPHANRWIILIGYLIGLSIGVHLLNLLAIPAIVLVYYFKKYKVTYKGSFYALMLSFVIVVAIMYGVIPGTITIASWFELMFVNGIGLPFHSGSIFFLLAAFGGLAYGTYYSYQKGKVLLNTILLFIGVILIGYSAFAQIIIRSSANPVMNQNQPDDMFSLLSYLNRDQYGTNPVIYGQQYCAPMKEVKDGGAIREQIGGEYKVIDHKQEPVYESAFETIIPRMWSPDPTHVQAYKQWGNITGTPITSAVTGQQIMMPTFGENLTYMWKYQFGHMYWRYFMWNFVGRQNDQQGHGGILNGNWISGINFIDNLFLGDQSTLPASLKDNPARNTYYFLPLLLGLLGIAFQIYRWKEGGYENFSLVMLLFFMTGLAIVFYLNQYPYQPRERDYAYAGSFYAFAMWIGLGVLFLWDTLNKYLKSEQSAIVVTGLSVLVPVLMGAQNWDDHTRAGRTCARDFANNYLNSCDKNAIIYTNGDNDTFPLWYAQDVEGIRTDIRVCNLSYLQTDWYINQMRAQAYDSKPCPISLTPDKTTTGKLEYTQVNTGYQGKPLPLKTAIDWVASDDPETKYRGYSYVPGNKFFYVVDKQQIKNTKTVQPKDWDKIVDTLEINITSKAIRKNDLMILDMLATNNWNRPIYFATTVPDENYVNLQNYFQVEGLAYRVVPVKKDAASREQGRIQTDLMYDNMMNKFKWGGLDNPKVYADENIRRMCTNFRNYFALLAIELVKEGRKDLAKNLLNKCKTVIPATKVRHNYWSLRLADAAFQAGDNEYGREILKTVGQDGYEQLLYMYNLPVKFRQTIGQDFISINYSALEYANSVASQNNQTDISTDFTGKLKDIGEKFSKIMQ